MKNIIYLVSLFISFIALSQPKTSLVGASGGIYFNDNLGSPGYSATINYKYNVTGKFGVGGLISFNSQNTFPSFFRPAQFYVNGVPPDVDNYIRDLSLNEALNLTWYDYNVFQIGFMAFYSFPIKIFDFDIDFGLGAFGSDYSLSVFYLDEFSVIDNVVSDYTPQYQISSSFEAGWMSSLGVRKRIAKNLDFNVNYRINILFNTRDFYPGFSNLEFGLVYFIVKK